MAKTGQITVFLIVGAIILLAIVLAYQNTANKESPKIQAPSELKETIIALTEDCIKNRLQQGLIILGLQGGYIYLEPDPGYLNLDGLRVSYDYSGGYNHLPTTAQVEKYQLAKFIENEILSCTQFDKLDAGITAGKPQAQVTLRDKDAVVKLTMPVRYKSGQTEQQIEEYSAQTSTNIVSIIATANKIIQRQVESPDQIDLSLLSELPYSPKTDILNGSVTITTLTDNNGQYPSSFIYASSYHANLPPMLENPGELILKAGQPYQLEASDPEGDPITFYSPDWDTNLNQDGKLVVSNPGKTIVYVFAFDTHQNYDYQKIEVAAQ